MILPKFFPIFPQELKADLQISETDLNEIVRWSETVDKNVDRNCDNVSFFYEEKDDEERVEINELWDYMSNPFNSFFKILCDIHGWNSVEQFFKYVKLPNEFYSQWDPHYTLGDYNTFGTDSNIVTKYCVKFFKDHKAWSDWETIRKYIKHGIVIRKVNFLRENGNRQNMVMVILKFIIPKPSFLGEVIQFDKVLNIQWYNVGFSYTKSALVTIFSHNFAINCLIGGNIYKNENDVECYHHRSKSHARSTKILVENIPMLKKAWSNKLSIHEWYHWCKKYSIMDKSKESSFQFLLYPDDSDADDDDEDDYYWEYLPIYKIFVPNIVAFDFKLYMVKLRNLRNIMLRFIEDHWNTIEKFLYEPPNGLMLKKSWKEIKNNVKIL